MCGIVGYIGHRSALPILVEGLRRLEYRGYDSAGVALRGEMPGIWVRKRKGRVEELARHVDDAPPAVMGIAHTRWATHGDVSDRNAHPHTDTDGRVALVHNGVIENVTTLRNQLRAEGVTFVSETDTEVLAHLIGRLARSRPPLEAVREALARVRGTYGIAVIFDANPDRILIARNGSPLVIGVGAEETVVASDPQAIVQHTRDVVYLQDREIAVVTAGGFLIHSLDGELQRRTLERIEDDYDVADKEGFADFMLKEIHEQPRSIRRCLRGRLHLPEGTARLGGLEMQAQDLVRVSQVVCLGCGTSFHAGMAGAMAIEALARVPARAEIASEFRYRHPIVTPDALYLAVSQSGETADTLGAIKEVQMKGGRAMGVVNVVGSTIARLCGRGVYVHSGPEVSVASTKAFTSQVTALLVLTLMLARTRDLSHTDGVDAVRELEALPKRVAAYLAEPGPVKAAAALLARARYAVFLGRGYSYPVALEGALKLKELAYVPCEGLPAGEVKHGPIAMVEEGTPVVVVCPDDAQRDKVATALAEVKARGARVILVHSQGDEELAEEAEVAIAVPRSADFVSPVLTVLPLQLIAYEVACELGRDVDRPRNLAKSVTVE